MKVFIKKKGATGVVYLDNGVPLPIASIDDEPLGFPYTDKFENLRTKYAGYEIVVVEDKREPKVSGVVVDDARVASIPGAEKELGAHKPARQPDIQAVPLPYVTPAKPAAVAPATDIERAVCDKFRDYLKRWHYARGKEKQQFAADIEAVATFLIDVAPHLEATLGRIKDEETLEKKRFSLGD